MGEVMPIRPDVELQNTGREPWRQVLDYLFLPPIVGWDVTRWAGGRVLSKIQEGVESAKLVLDSNRLGLHREARHLPAKIESIEKDMLDINKKEHQDKPELIAIDSLLWYDAVKKYHREQLESGDGQSQDYVNQMLSIWDEAGVSHGELMNALSGVWLESPIAKELRERIQPIGVESTPTS